MNELDRLTLLKLATGIHFTNTQDFLSTLHNEFGTQKCSSLAELEAFLAQSIDFTKLSTEQEVAIEVPSLEEIEEVEQEEARRAASPPSSLQQPPVDASAALSSRPLSPSPTISVKTPSGRTLRSTASVAPSEPRRLRSSK
jgi:hypothetical protein